MHPAALFFVLLFLPNSTLRDWQNASAPNLHRLMQTGAVGLMNARTAEVDQITEYAGIDSILSGARMNSLGSISAVDGGPLPANLLESLREKGVDIRLVTGSLTTKTASTGTSTFTLCILPPSINTADQTVGYWATQTTRHNGTLLIVSPNPNAAEYGRMDQLTPVVLWGRNVQKGFLSSSSTRTKGLIVNSDLAPTIASFFGAALAEPYYGEPIKVTPDGRNNLAQISGRDGQWIRQAQLMKFLPYVAAILAILTVSALLLQSAGWNRWPKITALAAAVPVLLILTSSKSLFIVGTCVLAAGIWALRNKFPPLITLLSFAAFYISIDILALYGRVSGSSLLGYSPIEGARYYGVGNEIMGVYVGALVACASYYGREWKILPTCCYWGAAGLMLSLPMCGAKAGGMIVCLVTLAGSIMSTRGNRLLSLRTVSLCLAAVAAALLLLFALGHVGPRTHITGAMEMAHRTGPATYLHIAVRKAAMDLHLIFHSVWIWVLLTTSFGRWLKFRKAGATYFSTSVQTGTAAVLACLLFNDAGVVAAALCSLIVWSWEASSNQFTDDQSEQAH